MRPHAASRRTTTASPTSERVTDAFFNDARTFGVVPTAFYETGFKPSIGARLIHRDLFGDHESLRLRALFAGLDQQHYSTQLHSGARLGELRLQLGSAYERYHDNRFYGLGNADEVDRLRGHSPRSAFARDIGVSSRYRSEEARGSVGLTQTLSPTLALGASLQLRRRALSVGDERPIDAAARVFGGPLSRSRLAPSRRRVSLSGAGQAQRLCTTSRGCTTGREGAFESKRARASPEDGKVCIQGLPIGQTHDGYSMVAYEARPERGDKAHIIAHLARDLASGRMHVIGLERR